MWKHFFRARSQCASTVTGDDSTLLIISGYNPDEEDETLSSIEAMTTDGPKREFAYPTLSRLAAAVTLARGAVVVTGGRGSETEVWMNSSNNFKEWERRNDMTEGRKGHAAAVINLGRSELVVVAGGWNYLGQELTSVNVYNPEEDKWSRMPNMPSPRVDFNLQVNSKSYL